MSQDFANRIKAIGDAYSAKKASQKVFLVAWSKVMADTILPVMQSAREHFNPKGKSLNIQRNGDITLEIRSTPVGKDKKLIYSPRASSEEVAVQSYVGVEQLSDEKIPLDLISTELVESHIETFLKEALRIRDLGNE